ncbi:MAG TPA: cbb3-type cytochrome c oxidase subunit I [Tepidisphaeraceae bacterium]|jgi:cytochrome c oxidase subunit 1|nr:cbb3-type cytochrome c oxidase subunit I [Tepidisphaeraceae bacterium]
MSSVAHTAHHAPTGFIRKYVFSLDHKVIGIQYYFLALFSVFLGMFLSLLMRFHMVLPDAKVAFFEKLWPTAAAGGVMTPELYLSLMTMHGTIMVFFVLTTAPQSGFGNFFLPIQIGAEDMAFPVLNMLSFWTTFLALVVMVAAFFVEGGAPLGGWTAYAPLSALGAVAGPGQGTGQTLWVISIAIFCGASLMGAINFIATTMDLRAKGMTFMRLPLTCWTWLVTAILGLLGFAVLLAAGILLLLDRSAGTSFFIPAGLVVNDQVQNHKGGSPLLWQHLFWFFGHPEVYIAILPGMGVTSQVLSVFARKPIFGYRAMVYAIMSIGFLGFVVWGHHMFMSGMSPYSAMAFSVLTMTIGVPSAIKTFNWVGTLWGSQIRFTTAMLFALGFVSLFVSGGISGIFLGQPALDLYFHDTYFVVGHFHMIMGVAAIFGMFAGTFYWFPKMFGRMLNETLGKLHFYLTFIGVYAIFTPMHFLGVAGNPRRYPDFKDVEFMAGLMPVHQFMTAAAFFTIAAQFIFVINLFWSMKKGAIAPVNPWQATTLEWTVPSPPPFDNFAGVHPVVNHGPYEYSVPGAPKDFVMQTDPPLVPGTVKH